MAGAKKHSVRRGIVVAFALVAAFLLTGFFTYVNNYSHADEAAIEAAVDEGAYSSDNVTVQQVDGNMAFVPSSPFAGLVFYPGGKVEASAYAPLMQNLAREGVLCVICPMPFNLAVFGIDAADGVRGSFPEVGDWYIGGHSLGGSMAAMYLDTHPGDFKGLVLLGSYSTVDLSDDEVKVLSIMGTNDGAVNRDNYAANLKNIPGAREERIQGGNHGQFGSYGPQRGDGEATISPAQQWEQTARIIAGWMRK